MGAQIYYAEGVETLSSLLEARPTIMTCVPRLYEVLRQKITTGVERAGRDRQAAVPPGPRARPQALPRAPVAAAPGRGRPRARPLGPAEGAGPLRRRLKAMVSGGARSTPTSGCSSTRLGCRCCRATGRPRPRPVISVNLPGQAERTVGQRSPRGRRQDRPGRRDPGARRPGHARGYWNDEAATAQALRRLAAHRRHRRDRPDGCIRITDRKKDIIVARATTSRPRGSRASCCSSPRSGQAWSTVTGGLTSWRWSCRTGFRARVRARSRARARPLARSPRTRLQGRDQRGRRPANQSPVRDRAVSAVPRHARAVQHRERADDADPEAAPQPDRERRRALEASGSSKASTGADRTRSPVTTPPRSRERRRRTSRSIAAGLGLCRRLSHVGQQDVTIPSSTAIRRPGRPASSLGTRRSFFPCFSAAVSSCRPARVNRQCTISGTYPPEVLLYPADQTVELVEVVVADRDNPPLPLARMPTTSPTGR